MFQKNKKIRDLEASRKCKERDKKCIVCNHSHSLNAHHIIGKGQNGGDELENLVTLCFRCHRSYHDGHFDKIKFIDFVNKHFEKIDYDIRYRADTGRIRIDE